MTLSQAWKKLLQSQEEFAQHMLSVVLQILQAAPQERCDCDTGLSIPVLFYLA